MPTIFKKLIYVSIIFSTLNAMPTGTVLDIFDIQVDALNKNLNKNVDKISKSMMETAKLAFELSDVNVDPDNIINSSGNNVKHDTLTNIVDSVYKAWKNDTRLTLVQNLNTISNAAEAYKNVSGLTHSLSDLEDSAKELGKEIMKNPNIINLVTKKDYSSIAKLVDKGSKLYKSLNNIPEPDANILLGLTQKEVANHWQNEIKDEVGQKLYIQELLIKRWQQNGTVDKLGMENVKKLNVYSSMDPGGWAGLFGKRELESTRALGDAYNLLSPSEVFLIENPTEEDTNKEKFDIVARDELKNNKNKENLDKLSKKDKQLKDKIKGLGTKKSNLARKKDELEQAKQRLASTKKYNTIEVNKNVKVYDNKKVKYLQRAQDIANKNSGKSFNTWSKSDQVAMGIIARNLGLRPQANRITQRGKFLEFLLRIKSFSTLKDKYASTTTILTGTRTEYNYEYQTEELLVNTLINEVDKAQDELDNEFKNIRVLESEKNNLMFSINDTVDDYNDEVKTQTAAQSLTNNFPIRGEIWLGSMTFNSEDRLPGGGTKLRYWGGQFDQSVDEALRYSGGGPIFNGENQYKILNGKVTSFEIGHGENIPTDNTKEFHIFNNEIDTASSFYNDNLNTLKLERQLPNAETLSIQTTGHYDYSAWGEWGQTGGLYTDINGGSGIEQKAIHNNWQIGQRTQDLPIQGSATYAGVVNGHYYSNSIGSSYGGKINGTMSMTVDFANTSVVSGVLNLQKESGGAFATAHMDQMQINRSVSGFAGRLVGTNVASISNCSNCGSQNMIVGQFNGPSAQEVSGIWNITSTSNEQASGTFAGKK